MPAVISNPEWEALSYLCDRSDCLNCFWNAAPYRGHSMKKHLHDLTMKMGKEGK